jgi:ergothioneine biosynthesis protein EgtB
MTPILAPTRDQLLELAKQYQLVRQTTVKICEPLTPEEVMIQSMPDVSPPKWHLAHTSWFFETFVLQRFEKNYQPYHPQFHYLYNSYYNSLGQYHAKSQRGFVTRPTLAEIMSYRNNIDQRITQLIDTPEQNELSSISELIELGIHHEQQHQELMLMDIKANFFANPLYPSYLPPEQPPAHLAVEAEVKWLPVAAGISSIGADGQSFCYDNEKPRHRVFVEEVALADRLITNSEYLAFIDDGGYTRPELWLSEGWQIIQEKGWQHPLYWVKQDGKWFEFTLSGLGHLLAQYPVCHISLFEADAFARWRGLRLPFEEEWETAAQTEPIAGNFMEDQFYHPKPHRASPSQTQLLGDLWEWTLSSYTPYPGFKLPTGAIGEYNGKFMCNQYVLRGGACVTSRSHIRHTYRNYFPAKSRWQFSGIRLAKER